MSDKVKSPDTPPRATVKSSKKEARASEPTTDGCITEDLSELLPADTEVQDFLKSLHTRRVGEYSIGRMKPRTEQEVWKAQVLVEVSVNGGWYLRLMSFPRERFRVSPALAHRCIVESLLADGPPGIRCRQTSLMTAIEKAASIMARLVGEQFRSDLVKGVGKGDSK